jgi:hypothetical protein
MQTPSIVTYTHDNMIICMNWKGIEGSGSGLLVLLWHLPGGTEANYDIGCPDLDSNPVPPEDKSRALPLDLDSK